MPAGASGPPLDQRPAELRVCVQRADSPGADANTLEAKFNLASFSPAAARRASSGCRLASQILAACCSQQTPIRASWKSNTPILTCTDLCLCCWSTYLASWSLTPLFGMDGRPFPHTDPTAAGALPHKHAPAAEQCVSSSSDWPQQASAESPAGLADAAASPGQQAAAPAQPPSPVAAPGRAAVATGQAARPDGAGRATQLSNSCAATPPAALGGQQETTVLAEAFEAHFEAAVAADADAASLHSADGSRAPAGGGAVSDDDDDDADATLSHGDAASLPGSPAFDDSFAAEAALILGSLVTPALGARPSRPRLPPVAPPAPPAEACAQASARCSAAPTAVWQMLFRNPLCNPRDACADSLNEHRATSTLADDVALTTRRRRRGSPRRRARVRGRARWRRRRLRRQASSAQTPSAWCRCTPVVSLHCLPFWRLHAYTLVRHQPSLLQSSLRVISSAAGAGASASGHL